MNRTQLSSKGSFLPINRVEALTDGVFAIAMTLLVLELGMPVITGGPVNTELLRRLFDLWPKLLV
ncbi:MAG: TMEM175 family protein, partial [Dehalococcoidia bacterium]